MNQNENLKGEVDRLRLLLKRKLDSQLAREESKKLRKSIGENDHQGTPYGTPTGSVIGWFFRPWSARGIKVRVAQ